MSTALARFASLFPGLPLRSPEYPTEDGWIPARWFDVFADEEDAVESSMQLRVAQATAHGQQLAQAGGKAEVQRVTRRIHRRAFPMLYRRRVRVPEET